MSELLDPIEMLRTKLAELNACTDNAWVLAFDNGVGVKLSTEPHDPRCSPCCITLADKIATDDMPQAKVRRRQDVIGEERARIEQALDYVNSFNLEQPFANEANAAFAQTGAS
jgi:hypothetical protein